MRSDALANQRKIVEAATRLMAEQGLEAELTDIANEAGVGVGTVYRCVGNRDQVIETIVRDVVGQMAASFDEAERPTVERAYAHMGLRPGQKMTEVPIDVCFIGSCTNSRISDLRTAAELARGRRVAEGVKAIVVPGSQTVKQQAEEEGLDRVFTEAGFEWRHAGCSMCLGMNTDKLVGDQVCASTSNRNFIGRQGSPRGRTLLMSPSMAAAAALEGRVSDARTLA